MSSICAKATNDSDGRIMQPTEAHQVVFPEARMGEQVAHLLNGHLMDWLWEKEYRYVGWCCGNGAQDSTVEADAAGLEKP